MNGHANCILAVCCPPESEARIGALAEELAKGTGLGAEVTEGSEGWALVVSRWLLANYDLAPPGSLQPFKDEIARLAREGHVKIEGGEGL